MDKHCVLVIDDEHGIYCSVKMLLRRHAEVLWAEKGVDAKRLLKSNKIHLCMIDYRLEDMSGDDLLVYIRRHYPHIPTIFLTAYPNVELRKKVTQGSFRADHFVTKPFDNDDLVGMMKDCLEQYQKNILKTKQELKTLLMDQQEQRDKRLMNILDLIDTPSPKWTARMLARDLGVTKSQIARDIQKLRRWGHTILSSHKGYCLKK